MNRLLLLAYPKSYRSEHGAELLACLAEAHPGRRVPPAREIVALLRGGVQAHARAATDDTSRPWWLDGLQLAALALAMLALVPYLQDVWNWTLRIDPGSQAINFQASGWLPWASGPVARILPYGLLPLVALIALLRGRAWIAVPASGAMVFTGLTHSAVFGDQGVVGVSYYGLGAPILNNDLVLSGLLLVGCVALAAYRPGLLRRRSYGPYVAAAGTIWLAVTAAAVQTLYWHRPSDTVSATLLACAFYSLATQLLQYKQTSAGRGSLPVLALAAVAALAASSRTDAYGRPLVFAGVGVLCAGLLWFTACRTSPTTGARSRWWSGRQEPRATADRAGPPPPPQPLPPATTR